jgi:outer membrane murein-binding lipoprotein Lpp
MRALAGFALALGLLLHGGAAFGQSDYEIIEGFKKSQQALTDSIRAARDPGQLQTFKGEIDALEADYARHEKLLADGLYPGSLGKSLDALREQLQKAAERLAMVEQGRKDKEKIEADGKTIATISQENVEYRASVERLTGEVQALSARIEQLSAENAGLVSQIEALQAEGKRDKATIAKLRELTDRLNANIRDRDQLIASMMDNMFGEYSKPGMTDEQRKNLFVNAQGNDYVGKIVSTVDGNLKYVQGTVMSAADVAMIRDEERKLSAKWSGIKPHVGKLYPDEQTRTRDLTTVDTRLAEWRRGIDDATWKGIRQVFAAQNVDIGPFGNAAEFQARLVAYVDAQTQKPSRATFRLFKEKIWDSPIKDQWLPVIPTDELTADQRATIEARVAFWEKRVSAMFLRWLLLGALGVVALGVVLLLLLRRKRNPPPTASQEKTAQVNFKG